MIVERFAKSERELALAGLNELYNIIISNTDEWSAKLRFWKKRSNGNHIVSPANRNFYSRLMYGADLKNQARSMISEGLAAIQHLNLQQLLLICHVQTGYIDWIKSETKIIREFARHTEEAIQYKLVDYITNIGNIETSVSYLKADTKCKVGLKILFFLGTAATYHNQKDNWWYILITSKYDDPDADIDEPLGFFCLYPSLKADSMRPEIDNIYSLATSCKSQHSDVFQVSNYCVTSCDKNMMIDDFAKYLHSFKDVKLAKTLTVANLSDDNEDAESSSIEIDQELGNLELEQVEMEQEVEADDEEGDYEWEYIADPDEGYTLYWDPYNEMYMYYDYPIQYEIETENYYIYDEEQHEYYYLDEESTKQINEGEVPTWNYEIEDVADYEGYYLASDGYYYPIEEEEAVDEVETPEKTTDENVPPTEPEDNLPPAKRAESITLETPADSKGSKELKPDILSPLELHLRMGSQKSMRQACRLRTAEQLRASDSVILQKATEAVQQDLVSYFGESGVSELLDCWIKRSNGELRVGRNKRLIQGLISGELELKALPMVNVTDVQSVLSDMNLLQIVNIRLSAQRCTWENSPISSIRVFAIKADATVSERLLIYCLNKNDKSKCIDIVKGGGNLTTKTISGDFKLVEFRFMARQLLQLYGASLLWKDNNNMWSHDSWWFVPADISSSSSIKSMRGIFVHVPTMIAQTENPNKKPLYYLSRGSQNLGYVIWDILPLFIE